MDKKKKRKKTINKGLSDSELVNKYEAGEINLKKGLIPMLKRKEIKNTE